MSATAPHLRHYGDADYSWVGAGLGMLALALGSGYTLAMGEMAGLYVGLSLVCAVAVLLDFRTGAVLLLLLLPVSASSLFPRKRTGIPRGQRTLVAKRIRQVSSITSLST